MSNSLIHRDVSELKEIKSPKLMQRKFFHPEGLFSEQIFGPVKNYTCQCGKYYGTQKREKICTICNVKITNSYMRRETFAKIVLPMKVINPLYYDLLMNLGGTQLKKIINELLKNEKSVLIKEGDEFLITTDEEKKGRGYNTWEKSDAVIEIIKEFSKINLKEGNEEWKVISENIEDIMINTVIVLPPDLRPISRTISKKVLDPINRKYQEILVRKKVIEETIVDVLKNKKIFYNYMNQLQRRINELYNFIFDKISKKEGLLRGNILGKRIDFSGRGVIVPDPSLEINSCSLPYMMILEILKLKIAMFMIKNGMFKLIHNAIDFIDECIDGRHIKDVDKIIEICNEIAKNEVCILNRQPSLHRLGMMAFNKIIVHKESVIKIHPLICHPFNADFDGDQMAVYFPLSDKAKEEAEEKMLASRNLRNPSNNQLSFLPTQDIVLGIFELTKSDQGEIIEYKGKNITKGRARFNDCLPNDFEVIDERIDKKRLIEVLNKINDNYSELAMSVTLDRIKKLGFLCSTVFGFTFSIDDLEMEKIKELKEYLYKDKDIKKQLFRVTGKRIERELKENFKYHEIVESGARGSWDQIKQIILTRGFISNFKGEIIPKPIENSFLEGLDKEEFFLSTYGCRKGLLDVALNTSKSGYLSRKLIFSCVNLELGEEEDCGSEDFIEIKIEDEKKAFSFMYRYFKNEDGNIDIITKDNYKSLIGQTTSFRTPIFCLNERICHRCYGDLYKYGNSKYIGIIAAQSLGERSTQLVLRTFHTSGSAITSKNDDSGMKQMDIVSDLSLLSKILHSFEDNDYNIITEKIYNIYNSDILHIHFECLVSQLMWCGNKKWRLYKNRDSLTPEYISIQAVPTRESWILGMAFSSPKKHVINGIINKFQYKGIFDKIIMGKSLTDK